MLTVDQRALLENVLESLNRLYDRDSTVVDVYSLLFATGIALRGSELAQAFEEPTRRLRDLADQKRDIGLNATDGLRMFIAERLRRDATANPKRRHVPPAGNAEV